MSRPSNRRPLAAANWKMHLLRKDAEDYCRSLLEEIPEPAAEVVLFPGFTLLSTVARRLAGSAVAWGGQTLHTAEKGAHTGDTSAAQLADVGCSWVLCGHSERRQDHGEGDALVGRQAAAARRAGLQPMICLGEVEAEREAGRTFEVLERQLRDALDPEGGNGGDFDLFVLAYEPVWAIGTGATATPELAQEAHAFLRSTLAKILGRKRADEVRILYGGSVKPDNAAGLIVQEDIDGFLVGGAGLDPKSFSVIISVCGSGSGS